MPAGTWGTWGRTFTRFTFLPAVETSSCKTVQ
jgi:hypothetical protein